MGTRLRAGAAAREGPGERPAGLCPDPARIARRHPPLTIVPAIMHSGLFEDGSGGGEVVVEIAAHAYGLGALAREEEG